MPGHDLNHTLVVPTGGHAGDILCEKFFDFICVLI